MIVKGVRAESDSIMSKNSDKKTYVKGKDFYTSPGK